MLEWERLKSLAEEARKTDNISKAQEYWWEALRYSKESGEPDERTVCSLENLAILSECQEKDRDAEIYWLHAVRLNEQLLGAEQPSTAELWQKLGNLLHKMCKYHQAVKAFHRALVIYEKVLNPQHVVCGIVSGGMARSYYNLDKEEESEHYFKNAIEILSEALGSENTEVKSLTADYVNLLEFCGRGEEAKRLLS